jgi:hypothetical protein
MEETGAALADARADLAALLERAEIAQGRLVKKRLADLDEALRERPLDRTKANALLRQVFGRIVMDFDAHEFVLHWRHGGESRCAFSTTAYGFEPVA